MSILSETFLLESNDLDQDHEQLAQLVEEITAMLDSGKVENCKAKVEEFIKATKRHFAREEQFLAKVNYPHVEKHSLHHRQLYIKMDHILEFTDSIATNEMARESLKKELTFLLMDDVITTDLGFKEFLKNL